MIIVADPEFCKEVGIKKFKSIPNRSLPSPIAGSPLHQKGLFFTRYIFITGEIIIPAFILIVVYHLSLSKLFIHPSMIITSKLYDI